MPKYWKFTVYDSSAEQDSFTVPLHRMSDNGAIRVAQSIASKWLTNDEIFRCFVTKHRGAPTKVDFLEPLRGKRGSGFSVGENPYVTVRVVEIMK